MVDESLFISTEELAGLLGTVQVIDASMKPGVNTKSAHFAERIPGAKFFSITEIKDTDSELALAFPSAEQFVSSARKIGLKNEGLVVVYDQFGLFSAPRGFFMLKYFGFSHVKVLEGGLPKWKAEGRSLESGEYDVFGFEGSSELHVQEQPGMIVNFPEVDSIVQALVNREPTKQLWDPRNQAGFSNGAVPESICIDISQLITAEGAFKEREEVSAILTAGGLDLSRPVVTTCQRGVVSSIGYLALLYIGKHDVENYVNSYDEWKSLRG